MVYHIWLRASTLAAMWEPTPEFCFTAQHLLSPPPPPWTRISLWEETKFYERKY